MGSETELAAWTPGKLAGWLGDAGRSYCQARHRSATGWIRGYSELFEWDERPEIYAPQMAIFTSIQKICKRDRSRLCGKDSRRYAVEDSTGDELGFRTSSSSETQPNTKLCAVGDGESQQLGTDARSDAGMHRPGDLARNGSTIWAYRSKRSRISPKTTRTRFRRRSRASTAFLTPRSAGDRPTWWRRTAR